MAKRKHTQTVLIFNASKTPNEKDELNWYEFMEINKNLKTLQALVGGNIEILPHLQGWDAPFMAYADEEGLLKQNSARNDLAGGALYGLGFRGSEAMGMAYAGNVVVLKKNERGLTLKDKAILEDAIQKYRKERDQSDEEDNEEEDDDDE